MKKILILSMIYTSVYAETSIETFIELAKKTRSVYSQVSQIDKNNSSNMFFETLLSDQRIYLHLSATNINSTAVTVINADASSLLKNKALPTPSEIHFSNLNVMVDGSEGNTNCDGSDVVDGDKSCAGKKCTYKQLIASKLNEALPVESQKNLLKATLELSGPFDMLEKIDITSCVDNNFPGKKHTLELSEVSGVDYKGGQIHATLILPNDSISPITSN